MASSREAEDDDYAKTLRKVMQDCLPPILVEVVEKRPLDPIAYIAEGLYRYRGKENAGPSSSIQSSSHPTPEHNVSTHTVTQSLNANPLAKTYDKHKKTKPVKIVEGSDEDFFDELNGSHTQEFIDSLHQCCITVLNGVDMFDDEDLS